MIDTLHQRSPIRRAPDPSKSPEIRSRGCRSHESHRPRALDKRPISGLWRRRPKMLQAFLQSCCRFSFREGFRVSEFRVRAENLLTLDSFTALLVACACQTETRTCRCCIILFRRNIQTHAKRSQVLQNRSTMSELLSTATGKTKEQVVEDLCSVLSLLCIRRILRSICQPIYGYSACRFQRSMVIRAVYEVFSIPRT